MIFQKKIRKEIYYKLIEFKLFKHVIDSFFIIILLLY